MVFSIVIPVFNEADCIEGVISEVLTAFDRLKISPAEIVAVDDGSIDDTANILAKLAKNDNRIRIITHSTNQGIGMANRTGFAAARGEWVGWVPADGQINPVEILNLYLQNKSADVIAASAKFNDRLRTDNFLRTFISGGLYFLIRLFTGWDSKKTGIFLFKKKIYRNNLSGLNTGLFNIFFPVLSQKEGLRVIHAIISLRPRICGYSKVANPNTILKTFYELLKFRFKSPYYKR